MMSEKGQVPSMYLFLLCVTRSPSLATLGFSGKAFALIFHVNMFDHVLLSRRAT
jgi:hypothetical protein